MARVETHQPCAWRSSGRIFSRDEVFVCSFVQAIDDDPACGWGTTPRGTIDRHDATQYKRRLAPRKAQYPLAHPPGASHADPPHPGPRLSRASGDRSRIRRGRGSSAVSDRQRERRGEEHPASAGVRAAALCRRRRTSRFHSQPDGFVPSPGGSGGETAGPVRAVGWRRASQHRVRIAGAHVSKKYIGRYLRGNRIRRVERNFATRAKPRNTQPASRRIF